MRFIFALVAFLSCSSVFAQQQTPGIMNFREFPSALEQATGIQISKNQDIDIFVREAQTRMFKDGVITEINPSTLKTYVALAGLFCKAQIDKVTQDKSAPIRLEIDMGAGGQTPKEVKEVEARKAIVNYYAHMFLDRDATLDELQNNEEMRSHFDGQNPTKFAKAVCAKYAVCPEFLKE